MAKISTSLVNVNPVLHSGRTSERGRGVEYHVTGSGRRRDPPLPPPLSSSRSTNRFLAIRPLTRTSPASYTRPKPPAAPSQHSYPLLTRIYYAKAGLSGEACCFGLVRDRVGSPRLGIGPATSLLWKKKKRKTNTVSSTQRSC